MFVTTTKIMLFRMTFVIASSMKTPSTISLRLVMTRDPGVKMTLSGQEMLHLNFTW